MSGDVSYLSYCKAGLHIAVSTYVAYFLKAPIYISAAIRSWMIIKALQVMGLC